MPKVVLAYTGNVGTTLCISWLRMKRGYDVTTFSANVGQDEFLEPIGERALAAGAESAEIYDLRDRFLREYCFPALQAQAVYQDGYHLFTALARPLIVQEMVKIAIEEGAEAIAHGCWKPGNGLIRFERLARSLAPHLKVIAPLMEWGLTTRELQRVHAERYDLPVKPEGGRLQSIERNIWGSAVAVAAIHDPWEPIPEEAYRSTVSPDKAPDTPVDVVIGFDEGIPTSLDGVRLAPVDLVESLNRVAGAHGVGRHDIMEDTLDGTKLRQIYETPAATVLYKAHRAMAKLVHEKDLLDSQDRASRVFADLIYAGGWASDLREGLAAFFQRTQRRLTGEVKARLSKGHVIIVGRRSPCSRYDFELAERSVLGGVEPPRPVPDVVAAERAP